MSKKLTFQEALDEASASKNNSDLANLAHAMQYVQHARQELDALEEEIALSAAAIEAGRVLPVGAVKSLYDRARDRRASL